MQLSGALLEDAGNRCLNLAAQIGGPGAQDFAHSLIHMAADLLCARADNLGDALLDVIAQIAHLLVERRAGAARHLRSDLLHPGAKHFGDARFHVELQF